MCQGSIYLTKKNTSAFGGGQFLSVLVTQDKKEFFNFL